MVVIFRHWLKSLQLFLPSNFGYFFRRFKYGFYYATKSFLQYFGWLLVFYALLFAVFGDLILKASKFVASPASSINPAALLINISISVIWFILSTAFLLSVRRGYGSVDCYYFRLGFLRYIQLALIFSLLAFVALSFLISFGITVFPDMHWTAGIFFKIFELMVIFCWLDSNYSFRDLFYSFEKSLNIILYNLAFLFIIFAFWSISTLGIGFLEEKIMDLQSFDFMMSIEVLLVRYLGFFLDYFIIGILFTFYSLKKRESYARSVFEKEDN